MKIKIIILFCLLFTLAFYFSYAQLNTDNNFEMMMSFMSITIGFSITALSMIATSVFSKKLYKIEDQRNNSRTLLHILVNTFKLSTFLFIGNIFLIFLYSILTKNFLATNLVSYQLGLSSERTEVSLENFFQAIIWTTLFLSIYEFTKLLKFFFDFVIQSAK